MTQIKYPERILEEYVLGLIDTEIPNEITKVDARRLENTSRFLERLSDSQANLPKAIANRILASRVYHRDDMIIDSAIALDRASKNALAADYSTVAHNCSVTAYEIYLDFGSEKEIQYAIRRITEANKRLSKLSKIVEPIDHNWFT
jgi:HD superfamily phosphohydrolase